MYWVNTYKTSRSAGGLLTNSYYVDIPQMDFTEFWNWAIRLAEFDLAFAAKDTEILAMTAQPTGLGNQFAATSGRLWLPDDERQFGRRTVVTPLPWRWTLNVTFDGELGRGVPRQYHDCIGREHLDWDDKGGCVYKAPVDFIEQEHALLGMFGATFPQWMKTGVGGAAAGAATEFREVVSAMPSGITVKNSARKAQRRILNSAVTLQAKVIGILAGLREWFAAWFYIQNQRILPIVDGILHRVVGQIMGAVIGLFQAHVDISQDSPSGQINQGDGWRSRFGATQANIIGRASGMKAKYDADMENLQKYPFFTDPDGHEFFNHDDAMEWFRTGDEWVQYLGGFGGFDFLNPDQEGLRDMSRLDNYTPGWPDLPYNAGTVPQPQKNPKRLHEPFELLV